MVKVGINGFGRIGRNVVRAALAGNFDIEFVAVNDITDAATLAYLLKYDSVHGVLPNKIESTQNALTIDGRELRVFASKDPAAIPWSDLGAEIVVESTGHFTSKEKASAHLRNSVEHVIISAPSKDADLTVCMGVNEKDFEPGKHKVISNASCTTNCLAPVAKVLHEKFRITRGIMTTIHSYTNDQMILDLPHKDLRRGRAAALSMIPTTTGAAQAVGLVLPDLKGKFDGIAVRVPTSNVSLVDLTFNTEKPAGVKEINQAIRDAAHGELQGILTYSDEQLVSIDFNNNPFSSIVDTSYTRSVDPHLHKILSWYDNEWGYSNRILDLIAYMAKVRKTALTAAK
ncbi:MAG TPA: type I glyceraldehyde-3-phosphate dehydrogenase [Thermoanaerobaculia bacterium]|nr:type I glyceraldehyde-3-phosphate dehydrogenase [Thermoanaerobaculia bacterium]